MTNADILRVAMEQHAIDSSCSPSDFARSDNVVVISKPNKKARRYLELPFFCDLISYGNNIVASVDERIYEFVKKYIDTKYPHGCFETPQIHYLTDEFSKYGFLPCFQAEYWLPDVSVLRALPCRFETRILERGEFDELYLPEWSNALMVGHTARRETDALAVGAYDGDRLIGLSGCSADCDSMWQIGIDVLPEYRRQGVAAALTSQLAVEILKRGKVPFYCCAWSNLSSARNAIKSGFRPAWVEHTAIEKEKALGWNTNRHFKKKTGDERKLTARLETERLILREFELSDAEAMFRNWASDPEVFRYVTTKPCGTLEETREKIKEWLRYFHNEASGSWGLFAIELKSGGEVIGTIDYTETDCDARVAEIGYQIGKPWWGNGYTTEALRALLAYCFETVGLNRVWATCDPRNIGSGRVMQKAGLLHEGTFRQCKTRCGEPVDRAHYAMLAEDYFGRKRS